MAEIAQLVRASDCGSECRGFESRFPPHQFKLKSRVNIDVYVVFVLSSAADSTLNKLTEPQAVQSTASQTKTHKRMETLLGLIVGIGLSAACVFRVFVPLLGMSIAALSGHVTLAEGFAWIGTWPAVIAFSVATVVELATCYIPWVDNMMDAIMAPAAVIAGTILTASMLGDISPFLKWYLAVIAGGGVAATVQSGTVALRAGSSGTTGGMANPLVSTLEMIGSVLVTLLAIVLPILALLLVVWICYKMIRKIASYAHTRKPAAKNELSQGHQK